MNEEIFNKLRAFVIRESTVSKNETISRDTRIEDDLGVYGDDADEFLISFGKEFNVEVKNFPVGNYFSDEGDSILPVIIRFFTNRKKRERKVLTVGHLEKAIIADRLDEESISN